MPYALLADLVTALHLAIVAFVLVGLIAVPIGGLLGWRWVRRPLFRLTHLAVVAYVCFNAVRGELCFLTHWEHDLRAAAGQATRADMSFIGRLLHDLLFVEADQDLLHGIYLALGALAALGLLVWPPRRAAGRPKT